MLDSIQSKSDDPWFTRTGQEVVIRPICGDDESKMAEFHRTLSPETVFTRYFNVLKLSQRVAHERLNRICHPASPDETVLVVEATEPFPRGCEIVAVARLSVPPGGHTGEVAFVVSDLYQRQGIGTELLRRLLKIAQANNLSLVRAHILRTNIAMQRVCLNLSMHLVDGLTDGEMAAEIDLRQRPNDE